jgi:phosphatidylglycerophosphatase A
LSWILYFVFVVAFTSLACYVSNKAEGMFGEKDTSLIVIDEMVGFQWTMFLVAPTVLHVFIGFILFRLFDILKVFPAGYFQRRLPAAMES